MDIGIDPDVCIGLCIWIAGSQTKHVTLTDRLCSIVNTWAFVAGLTSRLTLQCAIACSVWVLAFDYAIDQWIPDAEILFYLYPLNDIILIWLGYYLVTQVLKHRNDLSFPQNPDAPTSDRQLIKIAQSPTLPLPGDRALSSSAFNAQIQNESGISYADLQYALDNQEFILRYQPILSLVTGKLFGFEALVRWNHPQRGELPPKDFLPMMEPTPLMFRLGWWVMENACQQLRSWQDCYPSARSLVMSVNLSPQQFKQPDLIEQVKSVLQKTGLPCTNLKLEVTETILMENADIATDMLQQLHDMGIKLSIDDFGTGYSSLGYLYRFPVDTLKIDRSFITDIDQNGEQVELVRTIMMLAWNLGLDVIAEGIETSLQLAQLRALRCQYGQGYFFSKPLTAERSARYLETMTGLHV
jgi:EAL domain-containing protein (putative c-di-GMP-specific phosphodiesterase class I)